MKPLEIELTPGQNCIAWAFVGSRVTVNPPPTNTDRDVLVLVHDGGGVAYIAGLVIEAGGEMCGKHDYGDYMIPLRVGDDNYLVTENEDYYNTFLRATSLAKHWNIPDKDRRHELFMCIVDERLIGEKIEQHHEEVIF